jgi:hypothetical protein
MTTSRAEAEAAQAVRVKVSEGAIVVELADGRTLTAPIGWYPRLLHATAHERRNWELIGQGEGIHWPDLDEDLSVAGLLAGRPSGESQSSLEKWLATRRRLPASRRQQPPARSRARRG